jgi:hypothetical protein
VGVGGVDCSHRLNAPEVCIDYDVNFASFVAVWRFDARESGFGLAGSPGRLDGDGSGVGVFVFHDAQRLPRCDSARCWLSWP